MPRDLASFVVTLFAIAVPTPVTIRAANFFVAPHGNPQGDGSRHRPWDLPTALTHPPAVQPGDTIWLDQGTYAAALVSDLHGVAERPITVRQLPGRRATLDFAVGGNQDNVLLIRGDHGASKSHVATLSGYPRSRAHGPMTFGEAAFIAARHTSSSSTSQSTIRPTESVCGPKGKRARSMAR